ncbi:MAG: hypothetical protein WC712_04230 [Candidatus Brocadiia bacterium]
MRFGFFAAFVLAAAVLVLWSGTAGASPTVRPQPEAKKHPTIQVGALDPKYNPILDMDFEVSLDLGLITGYHIESQNDSGARGGVSGIFPLWPDLGLYVNAGVSADTWNGKSGLGVTLGAAMYGEYGLDCGLMWDWLSPDTGVSLYQIRLFAQTGFTETDRIGIRLNIPMNKDTFTSYPTTIEWEFEPVFVGGLYWQHSWLDEIATEGGLYYAGGNVSSAMFSLAAMYVVNERVNFRFSAFGDFSGKDLDIGLFVTFRIGPGAVVKPAYESLRYYHMGTSSHGNFKMKTPYGALAPAWDPSLYWN